MYIVYCIKYYLIELKLQLTAYTLCKVKSSIIIVKQGCLIIAASFQSTIMQHHAILCLEIFKTCKFFLNQIEVLYNKLIS